MPELESYACYSANTRSASAGNSGVQLALATACIVTHWIKSPNVVSELALLLLPAYWGLLHSFLKSCSLLEGGVFGAVCNPEWFAVPVCEASELIE